VDQPQWLSDVLAPDDAVEGRYELSLAPVPQSAGLARRFVRTHAQAALPDSSLPTVELLTSELVTNAVVHGRSAFDLSLILTRRCAVVVVVGLHLATALQQPYEQAREGGWGLNLVAALAHEWSIDANPDGASTAWFLLLRTESPAVADSAAARHDSDRRDS